MANHAFTPTKGQREQVETLSGFGIGQDDICLLLANPNTGKPIDLKTLHKHFRHELDVGIARANAKVVESLFFQAVGRPAQFDERGNLVRSELRPEPAPAIFWTKARMKWSERVEITGKDGAPLFDLTKLSDNELDQFERLARKAALTGAVRSGEETTRH